MTATPQRTCDGPETAQERFNRLYITSSEICRVLGVTRPAVMQARRRKLLPDAVAVNGTGLYIWERHTAQPYIDAWRLMLNVRRNNEVKPAHA